jgi:2-polyprenyl-3-methyl-5-hydroxy-6-metoxy-1,4-benzoquinol methylase
VVPALDKLTEEFTSLVVTENPAHANFLAAALGAASRETLDQLEAYINYCQSSGLTIAYLVDCYNTITLDTQIEQIFFRKHKRYRWSRFSEVADHVYFNEEYMRKYMYGLALTAFLWPNHTAMHQFFERTFPRQATGNYLEIGPGHGYYFMEATKLGNFEKLTAIDISAASVALTTDIVRHFGLNKKRDMEILETDFLNYHTDKTFSCIVMGEVLEHVEQPDLFLRKIADLSTSETHVFVTTCINAPAVDHLYLFRDVAEVDTIIRDSGLDIIDSFACPYAGKTLQESIELTLPVNVAYVLKAA